MARRNLLPASLLLQLLTITLARASCYYPSGVRMFSDFEPCADPTARAPYSGCCQLGDVCLPSGLCQWPEKKTTYRGGCTDSTWGSPSCPNFCPGRTTGASLALVQCTPSLYCCPTEEDEDDGTTKECCTDGSILFAVNGTTPAASSGVGSPSATDSAKPTSGGASKGPGDDPDGKDDKKMKPLTVGIIAGVVGALVVFLIAGIALCCCLRRRRRAAAAMAAKPSPAPFDEHELVDQTQSRPATAYSQTPPVQQFGTPPPAYQIPVPPVPEMAEALQPHPGANGDYKKPTAGTSPAPGSSYQAYRPPQQNYIPPQNNAVESDSRPAQALHSYQPPHGNAVESDSRPTPRPSPQPTYAGFPPPQNQGYQPPLNNAVESDSRPAQQPTPQPYGGFQPPPGQGFPTPPMQAYRPPQNQGYQPPQNNAVESDSRPIYGRPTYEMAG